MCLAVPGRLLDITGEDEIARSGRVDFGGVIKEVCLDFLPEAVVDDYALVHVGFALTKIDEASAKETLALFEAAGLLTDELGEEPEAS